ncbi:hypothetical protein [Burkholderia sp. TSV86]|uniref:hypothetical protein n=1 Tax=Burkholderia sp. TSV86 TaxID=1385594 RepID=UPI0018D2597D|nr:hypothetical protein [Burkholderia sp. TSV86]
MKLMSGMAVATVAIAFGAAAPHTGPAHAWPDRAAPLIAARRPWLSRGRSMLDYGAERGVRGPSHAIAALLDARQMRDLRLPGS